MENTRSIPDPMFHAFHHTHRKLDVKRVKEYLLSDTNVESVNAGIIADVLELGVSIEPQDDDSIRSLLEITFGEWFHDRGAFKHIPLTSDKLVTHINRLVVHRAAKVCLSTYHARTKLYYDQDNLVVPLEHPTYESSTGTGTWDISRTSK